MKNIVERKRERNQNLLTELWLIANRAQKNVREVKSALRLQNVLSAKPESPDDQQKGKCGWGGGNMGSKDSAKR